MTYEIAIPDEIISDKIYLIRGQKVMLDNELSKTLFSRNQTA